MKVSELKVQGVYKVKSIPGPCVLLEVLDEEHALVQYEHAPKLLRLRPYMKIVSRPAHLYEIEVLIDDFQYTWDDFVVGEGAEQAKWGEDLREQVLDLLWSKGIPCGVSLSRNRKRSRGEGGTLNVKVSFDGDPTTASSVQGFIRILGGD